MLLDKSSRLSLTTDTLFSKIHESTQDWALCLLGLSLFIFIAGFFAFTHGKTVDNWFYIVVLPLTIVNMKKINWALVRRDWLIHILIVFFAYCVLSSFWSIDHPWTSSFKVLAQSFYLMTFFFALLLSRQLPVSLLQLLLKALLWVCMISAVISIAVWYTHNPLNTRLIGFFSASQSITSDWVYGIPVLIATYYLIAKPISRANLTIYMLGLPPLAYVLLTQSRGPLLALVCGIFVLMLCYRNLRSLTLFLLFVGVILVDHTLLSRSLDTFYFREAIWQTVFHNAAQSPWFGHGYRTSLLVYTSVGEFGHAHNAYLEMFFLGGVVGLLLQSILILGTLIRGLHYRQQPHMYLFIAIFICSLVGLASDGNRLVVDPRELWLSFWLPLFIIVGGTLCLPNNQSAAEILRGAQTA